jgi:arginine-tRNA-protein transferase
MQSLFRYTSTPSACGYLPDQRWSLEYEMVADLSADEFSERLQQGWRRFGGMLFRPQCPFCRACQSLRVIVDQFEPNRSQRRAWNMNRSDIEVRIGPPTVSRARLNLYDRFHAFQIATKGWPEHPAKDVESYRESFVRNPPFTEEWCYYLKGRLVGVGYADRLDDSMSAIYFFYDPELRARSLGTFNVLCLLDECLQQKYKHLYLGYYVAGCGSLEYKANFKPNQVLGPAGWHDFLG